MAQAKIQSASLLGIECVPVEVEVDVSRGLPSLTIVGLPSQSIEEARDRVRSALHQLDFSIPSARITINLAPAELKKEGALFDLPIALGLLIASGVLPASTEIATSLFAGELALDGSVRALPGILAFAKSAKERGFRSIFVPAGNAREAALIKEVAVYPVSHLSELLLHLRGERLIAQAPVTTITPPVEAAAVDFQYIAGQEEAKRALEIAAAGGHNVLLFGPPGTGKTLLARSLASILPPLSDDEVLEITQIHSSVGLLLAGELVVDRPFRAPHHTASHISVVGGGTIPRPGEVSLAHRGVLFFDELPEFPRSVLEALRQPLEDRSITISRVAGSLRFPADLMFIASCNPCPCGWRGDRQRRCICSEAQVARYRRKLSGPLLDRIDLIVSVPRVDEIKLLSRVVAEPSVAVKERVQAARVQQRARFQTSLRTNAHLTRKELASVVPLSEESTTMLAAALKSGKLTARGLHKTLRVARTIADLAGAQEVSNQSILEAIHYRTELSI